MASNSPRNANRCLLVPTLAFVLILGISALIPSTGSGAPVAVALSSPPSAARAGTGDPQESSTGTSVTINPAQASILSTTSLSFSADLSEPWLIIFTETWSLSPSSGLGSLSSSQGPSTVFTAASTTIPLDGSLSVSIIGFDEFNGQTVDASATAPIGVDPELGLSGVGASPNPARPGSTVTLRGLIEGGEAPFHVTWNFGDGGRVSVEQESGGVVAVTHAYAAGIYTPTLEVIDSRGGVANTSVESSLVVASGLAVALEAPSSTDVGVEVSISATVDGGTPPYVYHWSDSQGGDSYGNDSWSLLAQSAGTLGVALTVEDSLGEVATAPTEDVLVHPAPTLGLGALNETVDTGVPFPLEITIGGGSPPFTVSWSAGGEMASLTQDFAEDGNYTEPFAFDESGAVIASANLLDAAGVTVSTTREVGKVSSPPTVTLDSSPEVPRLGEPFNLLGSVNGGTPPYTYSFHVAGGVVGQGSSEGTIPGPGGISWSGNLTATGMISASFTVTDSGGGTASTTLDLEVVAGLAIGLTPRTTDPEVGLPWLASLDISGGVAPFSLTVLASDGESQVTIVNQDGVIPVTLRPLQAGKLVIDALVKDDGGEQADANTTIVVAAQLQGTLDLQTNPIDAGSPETVMVRPEGGWPPYRINLALSDGWSLDLPAVMGPLNISLPLPTPGSLVLVGTFSDASLTTSSVATPIVVKSPPQVALDLSQTTIDVGATLNIEATVTGGTGTISQSVIEPGDGNVLHGLDVSHVYSAPGTYLVNATVVDSAGGVAQSSPQSVNVVAPPRAMAVLDASAADVGLGAGFSSSVNFGVAPFSYVWNFGDGVSSGGADPTHVYTTAGLYHVSLTVTDADGVSAISPPLNVTVGRPLSVSLEISQGRPEVGIPDSFFALPVGGVPPYNVLWTFSDGTSVLGSAINHTFQAPGTYLISATVGDGAGALVMQSTSVAVAQELVVGVPTISGSGAEVGVGSVLAANAVGGVAPFEFSWSWEGENASGPDLDNWSVRPTTSGNQVGQLSVTDGDGAVDDITFHMSVASSLSLNLSIEPPRPEAGVPILARAQITGGVGMLLVAWQIPSNALATQGDGPTQEMTFPTAGPEIVGVSVTDGNGVMATSSESIQVDPPLTLTLGSDPPRADAGSPVEITALPVGGVGPVTVTYSLPGESLEAASLATTFQAPGIIPLVISATDADGARAQLMTNITVVPPLSLAWSSLPIDVAAGVPTNFSVEVTGGSSPTDLRWSVPGESIEGGLSADLTFDHPGSSTIEVTADDPTGDAMTLEGNVTVVEDPLSFNVTAATPDGIVPFATGLSIVPTAGLGSMMGTVAIDGNPIVNASSLVVGLPWDVPLVIGEDGQVDVSVTLIDGLGARVCHEITLDGFAIPPPPSVSPLAPTTQAGVPLAVHATLPGGSSEEGLELRWWGPGITRQSGPNAILLSNLSGTVIDELSELVTTPMGETLLNATFQEPVVVRPGPAVAVEETAPGETYLAGENASWEFAAVDAFGNVNETAAGNVSVEIFEAAGGGPLAEVNSALVNGRAAPLIRETEAGTYNVTVADPFSASLAFSATWVGNPTRAVLEVETAQTVGTTLVLRVSVRDVWGNPLDGVNVTATVGDGESQVETSEGGVATFLLANASEATAVTLTGPDGASTVATLAVAGPSGAGSESLTDSILFVILVVGAGCILFLRRRSRTNADPSSAVQDSMVELLKAWPGEEREALLLMAEERGVARDAASAALDHLKALQRVSVTPDEDGTLRWRLSPSKTPPDGGSANGGPQ